VGGGPPPNEQQLLAAFYCGGRPVELFFRWWLIPIRGRTPARRNSASLYTVWAPAPTGVKSTPLPQGPVVAARGGPTVAWSRPLPTEALGWAKPDVDAGLAPNTSTLDCVCRPKPARPMTSEVYRRRNLRWVLGRPDRFSAAVAAGCSLTYWCWYSWCSVLLLLPGALPETPAQPYSACRRLECASVLPTIAGIPLTERLRKPKSLAVAV